MKTSPYFILLFALIFSSHIFAQKKSLNEMYISTIDSLIDCQLKLQKQHRENETLVFLKDSIYRSYYDDVIDECEGQPYKYYYIYNEFGLATELFFKNTPETGCDHFKNKTIFTYEGFKLTDRINQYFDFDLNEWTYISMTTYQYDGNDNVTVKTQLNWDSENVSWQNYLKFTYLYSEELVIERKRYNWNSGTNDWFWNLHETNSYNANNDLLEFIYRTWDYGLNDWETLRKTKNSYDGNFNVTESVLFRKYSNENEYEWNIIDKINHVYDANNFIIEQFSFKNWNNSQEDWDTKNRFEIENDSNGNAIEITEFLWIGSSNNWLNDTFIINTYNSNNDILVSIKQVWQSNSWVNSDKKTKIYNSNFQVLETLEEDWVLSDSDWENDQLTTRIYNEFYNITSSTYQIWDTNYWYLDGESTYEYDEFQNMIHNYGYALFESWNIFNFYSEYDITLSVNKSELLKKYALIPNPSKDYVKVSGLDKHATVLFYNVSGERVLEINSKNRINISNLSNGLYFVKIITEDVITIKKFLKN